MRPNVSHMLLYLITVVVVETSCWNLVEDFNPKYLGGRHWVATERRCRGCITKAFVSNFQIISHSAELPKEIPGKRNVTVYCSVFVKPLFWVKIFLQISLAKTYTWDCTFITKISQETSSVLSWCASPLVHSYAVNMLFDLLWCEHIVDTLTTEC